MPFRLRHTLVSERLFPVEHTTPNGIHFTVELQGRFQVHHPGRFDRVVEATVRHKIDDPPRPGGASGGAGGGIGGSPGGIDDPGGGLGGLGGGLGGLGGGLGGIGGPPGGKGFTVTLHSIPCTLTIRDPHGKVFTAGEVTRADLDRYRDRRGILRGSWTFTLRGRSRDYMLIEALRETVTEPTGRIDLSIFETVRSESAPPLVPKTPVPAGGKDFSFDLHRVGTFEARIDGLLFLLLWQGTMTLRNPDGLVVASSTNRVLRADIPLKALGASRDAAGKPRLWVLTVTPRGALAGSPRVSATVLGRGRVRTGVLRDRIAALLGPGGEFIQVQGRNTATHVEARMTITDAVAAETIDMHGILDKPLKSLGDSTDIRVDETFTVYRTERDLGHDITLDASGFRLAGIDVSVGPGALVGADTPAVRLTLRTAGDIKVKWRGSTLATAKLSGGRASIEVGLRLDPDGTPRLVPAVSDKPFDIDLSGSVLAALLIALTPIGGGITAAVIDELIENAVNDKGKKAITDLFAEDALAPSILMVIVGAHLTYTRLEFEGDDIVFEHIAPLEPDPKPRSTWKQAIGRSWTHLGPGLVTFQPAILGDTWKAENLTAKIQHIVVVMMENRSYDHVLGYRSLPRPGGPIDGMPDDAQGLSEELIQALEGTPEAYTVRPLRDARFPRNAFGLRTRIPHGVGHEVEDVAEQLSGRIDGPGGSRINAPKGFVDNFREKNDLSDEPTDPEPTLPEDVLGFYDEQDLPIYGFLAKNYAYTDRYFCSHPGPTLPNRMYLLTGAPQNDRLGGPIIHNNEGDTFLLSRDQSIYDVLEKRGVSWRVYESAPSVTMLRMFARYATDDVNIRPISRLEADIAAGDVASFTSIEPAMHHFPPDDDHPDADMWRGQRFIHRVYTALRSDPDLWRRTLLIITYDEHGGLYDHIIPPVAEVLVDGPPDTLDPGGTAGGTGGGLTDGGAGGAGGGRGPRGTVGGVRGGLVTATSDAVISGGGSSGGAAGRGRILGGEIAVDLDDVRVLEPAGTDPRPPEPIETLIPYGLRVPTFVVSPWVEPGKGPNVLLDHCSIIKTVLARFAGDMRPFMTERVAASHSFEAFLTASQPRLDIPVPDEPAELPLEQVPRRRPGTSVIVTPPLSRKRMREEGVDYHDLSGWIARMLLGR